MSEITMKATNATQQKPVVNRRAVLTPRVDVLEQPEKLVLFADLPGVKPEDVELNFEKGELTVRAKRDLAKRPGRCLVEQFEAAEYHRSFLLSQDVAADQITAELKNGVLRVDLPRSPAALPRRIGVKACATTIPPPPRGHCERASPSAHASASSCTA
jgi:HSP20 family protein